MHRPRAGLVQDGTTLAHPVLALDVGGTKLAAGVVEGSGRVRSFLAQASRTERGPDAVLEDLFVLGRRAVAASGMSLAEIAAVGIGCGGPLDPVRERVRAEAISPAAAELEVVPAALGDRVGVVGAAAIAHLALPREAVSARGA